MQNSLIRGYVVQAPPRLDTKSRVQDNRFNVPETYIITRRDDVGMDSPENFCKHARGGQDKDSVNLLLPAGIVVDCQLRHGDEVDGIERNGVFQITHRNGIPIKRGAHRATLSGSLEDPYRMRSRYSHEWMDLSRYTDEKDIGLRMCEAIASQAIGKRHIIGANAFAGKTMLWQSELVATIRWIKARKAEGDPRMFRIKVLTVGEREEDSTDTFDVIQKEDGWDCTDLWEAPDTDIEEELARQYYLAEWMVNNARRCTEDGIYTFLFIDSMTRIFNAHAHATLIKKDREGGMLPGGYPVESLTKTKLLFSKAGVFQLPESLGGGETALTVTVTEIADDNSTDGRLFTESGPNTATGIWFLWYVPAITDDDGNRIMPIVDVVQTRMRRDWLYMSEVAFKESEWLRASMFPNVGRDDKGAKAIKAFKYLWNYKKLFPQFSTTQEELDRRISIVKTYEKRWWGEG